MSFVRVIVLLSLTYADAVRPMAAETDVDLGNQSYPDCLGNLGKCCTVKCNGKHKWVGKTVLTFSDCQRQPGAFINPHTKKPMRPGSMMLSHGDLPTTYGDYVCQEICKSSGYGPDNQAVKVYRAGGDPNEPPFCGIPMGGIAGR
ncbi:unnamed protein product [Cladocopium goreaui]|uniref:Secreted protein n=1 Tax=Cladocopium goreaui TaxID=2562237 RepID=A0A9P1CGJ8_9DINO|nr:unnamed protein product [Cladocopium goreaui]|mmetsp:Transcript_12107/g.26783  ORF Transcript_12107/g.26783 Transcript_12107/m.26783 type:complete len:145 (+) Transcript_12107:61-495(+)